VKAIINSEARYISQYPYCGSFQPPPESGLAPTHNDWADLVVVNPSVNLSNSYVSLFSNDLLSAPWTIRPYSSARWRPFVFVPLLQLICVLFKYEIDSLCGFLKLSHGYYQATNDSSFMNGNCKAYIPFRRGDAAIDRQGRERCNLTDLPRHRRTISADL
jgi:hypothetical protein